MLAELQTTLTRFVPSHLAELDLSLGGIDTGRFVPPNGSKPYHIIVPVLPEARMEAARWGRWDLSIPTNEWDGRANTAAILRADPENAIARAISAIEIGGHRDYYWASKLEALHVYRAIGPLVCEFLSTSPAWTSTQHPANSHGAFYQFFDVGSQYYNYENGELAGLGVRRLVI